MARTKFFTRLENLWADYFEANDKEKEELIVRDIMKEMDNHYKPMEQRVSAFTESELLATPIQNAIAE